MIILLVILFSFVLLSSFVIGLYLIDDISGAAKTVQQIFRVGVSKIVYLIVVYALILAILVYSVIGWVLLLDFNPGIPTDLIPYIVQSSLLTPIALILGLITIILLDSNSGRILHCTQPKSGDWNAEKITEKQWRDASVYQIVRDEDGNEGAIPMQKSDLEPTTVEVDKRFLPGTETVKSYECKRYDGKNNIIYVSNIAGLNSKDLREWQDAVEYAEKVLRYEAAKSSHLHSELADRADRAAKEKVNFVIHNLADAELPHDAVKDQIKRAVESVGIEYLPKDEDEIGDELGLENPTEQDIDFSEIADQVPETGGEQ